MMVPMAAERSDTGWGWDDAVSDQRRRIAALSVDERIAWLAEAQEVALAAGALPKTEHRAITRDEWDAGWAERPAT